MKSTPKDRDGTIAAAKQVLEMAQAGEIARFVAVVIKPNGNLTSIAYADKPTAAQALRMAADDIDPPAGGRPN